MVAPQYPPARNDTAPLPRIPAGPGRPRNRLYRALGLVAVAVVAGLVWFLVRHDTGGTPVAQPPAKEFTFTAAEGPVASTDCAAKSTDAVKQYFAAHPCQGLARALYTTTAGGAKALVSVALVTMPDAAEAGQLRTLADRDGTGNVSDLVRDGTAKISGAPALASGTYASRSSANKVTIVLSAFFDGHKDKATLSRVDAEALDLSAQLG